MSINITSIFLMSVLVLGFASYPSALPDLGQDITNSQLPLGNVAFAQEAIEVELKEEIGISTEEETEEETEGEENGEEAEDKDEIELEGILTVISGNSFTLEKEDGTFVTILTDGNTKFEEGVTLSILNGLEVEVDAVEIDGVLFATEIELEEENGEEEADEKELEGMITDVSGNSFTLEKEDGTSVTILTDGNTKFEDDTGLVDLNGKDVEVEVVSTEAGLLAIEIELEEYEGDEENGEDGNGDKTEICHVPPGNPSKAHTITIGAPAAIKHLRSHDGDVLGPCAGITFGTAKGEIYVGEQQSASEARLAEKEARLADKQAEREAKLAEKQAEGESRLAEKQMEFEARLAEKESQALQRADELIQRLEQRIADLELRLQTLLNKVETGEYFGTVPKIDPVLHSYSISIDGIASSLFDESVTTDVSGEIFIENLVTTSKVSKFKVTGGEIFVGDNIYDVVFGKARISSSGPSGEKDSMVLILQAMDTEGNTNTIRLGLNFGSALEGDFGVEPIELETVSNSKISGQWSLNVSGELSLLQS